MSQELILVVGGARSGKSRHALQLAGARGRRGLFVATATPGDEEMRRRIEQHRASRPPGWRTLEITRQAGPAILRQAGDCEVVLLDCLTLLLSNLWTGDGDDPGLETRAEAEVEGLLAAARELDRPLIVVANEVGMSIVPATPLGRRYRDLLGRASQRVAEQADAVDLTVAGIPVRIKPRGSAPEPL